MTYLFPYGWGYNAWSTRCNIRGTAHYVSRSVPYFLQTNVCKIRTSATIQFFWQFTCMLKLVDHRGATLHPLRHRADLGAIAWFPYRPSHCWVSVTTGSIHMSNPNLLQNKWDHLLANTLDPSEVIVSLCQICHPYISACRQFVHDVYKLQLQSLTWLMN